MTDDIKLPEPAAWLVCSVNKDGSLYLVQAVAWKEAAHEHINDAINEYDIKGAANWVVRAAYTADQVHAAIAAVEADMAQRKPLTDEQVYGVVSSIGPDVMELAKQWADNEIHSYSLTHQAEVLAAAIVRRTEAAHGITEPKGGSDA